MKKILLVLFPILFSVQANSQQLLADFGIGASVDGFLVDKEVLKYKNNTPFQIGPQTSLGLRMNVKNGFDLFLDFGLGINKIQFPVPGESKSGVNMSQLGMRVLGGSGLRIPVNEKNTFVPFIQLGAGYFSTWNFPKSQQQGNIDFTADDAIHNQRWVPMVGGGLEYQFNSFVPSSLNLSLAYTPMDIFRDPIPYHVETDKGAYDLNMQGKLLQVMFTFKVYLKIHKWADYEDNY